MVVLGTKASAFGTECPGTELVECNRTPSECNLNMVSNAILKARKNSRLKVKKFEDCDQGERPIDQSVCKALIGRSNDIKIQIFFFIVNRTATDSSG